MNLREALLKEHSKKNADRIVSWVGSSQERFDQLVEVFLNSEYRVVQHAAWPLSYCAIDHPEFVKKHIAELVARLKDPKSESAVKRNIVRLLPHVTVPRKYHGDIINACINFVSSAEEMAAVKAFSLHVLEKMLGLYPEIGREVSLIIHDQWDREPASFRSRAKKFLKAADQ